MHDLQPCILIFGRLPVAGACKTRLIPLLGADRAAALQSMLLRDTVHRVLGSGLATVQLWLEGPRNHPLLADFRRSALQVRFQQGSNLGERMADALAEACRYFSQVLLIGTDCPMLDAAYLEAALQRLQSGAELVLGPAEDGGYVLLGTTRGDKRLFEQIDWGSGRVLAQTLQRVEALGLKAEQLPALFDVDRPEDYHRAVQEGLIPAVS